MNKFIEINENKYKNKWIYLSSGDDEDYPGCKLTIACFKIYITFNLPPIIKPYKVKVMVKFDREEFIKRQGKDWYWSYIERQYGISYCDNYICIRYGIQTGDSTTEKSYGFFLPWNEWRMIDHRLYDDVGEFFYGTKDDYNFCSEAGKNKYDELCKEREKVPKVIFEFKDFDGEIIKATTHIEEREYFKGEGHFKWISAFCKSKIQRVLSINFSSEVGERKGSWKGGILGHSIEIEDYDIIYNNRIQHENAFRRYCTKNNLTFIGRIE
jgi:hypothetical protein